MKEEEKIKEIVDGNSIVAFWASAVCICLLVGWAGEKENPFSQQINLLRRVCLLCLPNWQRSSGRPRESKLQESLLQ